LFSAPNYCGEFDNDGSMLHIGKDLCCSFYKLTPAEKALKNNRKWQKTRPGTPKKWW